MTPEKQVQNSLIAYMKKLQDSGVPIYYERRQAGGFSYKMGIADLYAVINGQHIEIEVKAPGGKLSPMQEKWRDKCKKLHIQWCCVDNVEALEVVLGHFYLKTI